MGTVTYPKSGSGAKQLGIQETTINSFLKDDSNTTQVYGRGTGRDAAVETLELPPTRPPGHNTIGIGGKFDDQELKR